MKIGNLQNSAFFNLQNDSALKIANVKTQSISDINETSPLKTKSNFSFISKDIKEGLENISNIQQIKKVMIEQNDLVRSFQNTVKSDLDLNNKAVRINDIINGYNSNAKLVYSNLNELVEDQKSDKSYMYFDGILGSVPLSIEEINKAIQKQKQVIETTNTMIEQTLNKQVEFSKKVIKEQEDLHIQNKNFIMEFEKMNEKLSGSMTLAYPLENLSSQKFEVLA